MEKGPEINSQTNIENTKEDKETKVKIKIKIDDREHELEATSYDFEYPERIQKETGILGYKRYIVLQKEILKIEEDKLKDIGIDVKDFENFDSVNKLLKEVKDKKYKEIGFIDDGRLFCEQSDKAQKKWADYEDTKEGSVVERGIRPTGIFPYLDSYFSKGEFPKRTLNHQMGAFQSEEFEKYFIQDKFFIQKLFDVNLSQKIKLGRRATSSDSEEAIPMNVYYKNSNKIEHSYTRNISDYKDKINKNEVFLVGPNAFNTQIGGFWEDYGSGRTSFGFTLNDNLFKEYIRKAYKFFLEKNYDTESEMIGIEEIIRMLAVSDNDFYNESQKFFNDYYLDPFSKEVKEKQEILNQKFYKIIKDFLPNINIEESIINKKKYPQYDDRTKKYNYNYNEYFINKLKTIMDNDQTWIENRGPTLNHFDNYDSFPKSNEIYLPIFINNDKIIQISWGHAKYAHFFNQKGFNFFEFKHADHLPGSNQSDKSDI